MFKSMILCSLTVLVLGVTSPAYAGRTELTAYYPAPYARHVSASATKSLLPPRMSTAERNEIKLTSPDPQLTEGLIIYNTDNHQMEIYDGTAWVFAGGGSSAQIVTALAPVAAGSGASTVTITQNFPGGMVYVFFAAQYYWASVRGSATVRLYIDDLTTAKEEGYVGSASYSATVPISWTGNLSAGSHTIQVVCSVPDGYSVIYTGSKPRLTVIY